MSLKLDGGFYTGTDLADKVFYGFKLNAATGDLTVHIIDDESTIVSEPEPGESPYIIDPLGYTAFAWSRDSMNFSFNASNGHLQMTYL